MKYAVLSDENRVIDILIINPSGLYENARYISVSDETEVALGMVYNEETDNFNEYVEPTPEPTQVDRIEANLDYLVLLNS
nr:MAG TPA: hypothetical protein [Caudoviricetes sp.]